MNIPDHLHAALDHASPDWRPVLAARLLADELRRAAITGRLQPRIRQQINRELHRAADELARSVSRTALELGDIVVLQLDGRQLIGEIERMTDGLVWVTRDPAPWPRTAVIRNLTTRPEEGAAIEPEGAA